MRNIVFSLLFLSLTGIHVEAKKERVFPKLKVEMLVQGHRQDYQVRYGLEFKDGTVLVSGRPTNPIVLTALREDIQTVLKLAEPKWKPCYAGFYEHTLELKGKKTTTHNCLTDPEYEKLVKSFRRLMSAPPA